MADIFGCVGNGDVVFRLPFEDTAFAQQRVEPPQHVAVAAQGAAVVAHRIAAEYDIE